MRGVPVRHLHRVRTLPAVCYSPARPMRRSFESLTTAEPGAIALVDAASGTSVSRRELLQRSRSLSERLTAAGAGAGDVVLVRLPNSPDFVASFLATLELAAVLLPLDRDSKETEVAAAEEAFGAVVIIDRDSAGSIVVEPRKQTRRPALPRDARLIKLTSGSTGRARGIVTTEANLTADARNICATMGIVPADVNLGAIPFSHSYGFSNLVSPLLLQGTRVVVTNDYLPQALLDHANRHGCTVAPLIPMVYAHLITTAHGNFETVRTFISAGAPLPATTSRAFRERFSLDIHSFYGCSECGGIAYDSGGGAVERGTVGTALHGVELRIERGRLAVRSAAVAACLLGESGEVEPLGEAFVTDDLVEWRNGELALTGRAGDFINTAGKKVNPREIEAVLLEMEGVREARVYGEPAGARGEVVAAAVVAAPSVTREAIREFCRARLSAHKVPRVVKLIEAIPVDGRGKVSRSALLES